MWPEASASMNSRPIRRCTMADNDNTHQVNNEVGYGKPPSHTQFVKGQSGNPKGRPRGSQNLSSILDKVGRQRVKITENGRTRNITKSEAVVLQLWNKAVSGDLNASRVLQSWLTSFANPEQTAVPPALSQERDKLAMQSLVERIRQSEEVPSESADSRAADPSQKEE